jgi:hypothetical protein
LRGAIAAVHDEVGGEFRVSLASGTVLALRVVVGKASSKHLKKWVFVIGKLSSSQSLGGSGVPEPDAHERELARTIEECSFAQRLADLAATRHQAAIENVTTLEKRMGELRDLVEGNRKKNSTLSLSTPVRKPGSRAEYIPRHQGCSIALLIDALRSRKATPEQAAKHM